MELENTATRLSALSQPVRIEIFRQLVRFAGQGGTTPAILKSRLNIPAPTLSFHLSQLKQAGLISASRKGRQLFYSAELAAMRETINFLIEDCCAEGCGPDKKDTSP